MGKFNPSLVGLSLEIGVAVLLHLGQFSYAFPNGKHFLGQLVHFSVKLLVLLFLFHEDLVLFEILVGENFEVLLDMMQLILQRL